MGFDDKKGTSPGMPFYQALILAEISFSIKGFLGFSGRKAP
jgi:hypothetical protein